MRSFLKFLGLFLILGTPVIIYLFLQGFGENKYSIPVYHQNGLPFKACPPSDTTHHIPNFAFDSGEKETLTYKDIKKSNTVFYIFPFPCRDSCQKVMEALARVQNEYTPEEVTLVSITKPPPSNYLEELGKTYFAEKNQWKFLSGPPKEVRNFGICGLGLQQLISNNNNQKTYTHQLVLADTKGRIRGYYDGFDREETDRLILELRILLNETATSSEEKI